MSTAAARPQRENTNPLVGHPLAAAIGEQIPLDTWDLKAFGYPPGRLVFCGRADRAKRGVTRISQPWMLAMAKEWVLRGALRRSSSSYLDGAVMSIALLSATLRERGDAGVRPGRLGRDDINSHLIRLGQMRENGLLSLSGQQGSIRLLARFLEDLREWKVANASALPPDFLLVRGDQARGSKPDGPSKALPRFVVRQLLDPAALGLLESMNGKWAVNWFKLALGTGRRPGEVARLPLQGCLDHNVHRDEHGVERMHAVLVHDMPKVRIVGYRLPIGADMAELIEEQRAHILASFPETDAARLPLFPHPYNNDSGVRPVGTQHLGIMLRQWVEALPALNAPETDEDGRADAGEECIGGNKPFPRKKVYPYALRHTWAQDHADAGTPLEVLQDLLGHAKPETTQVYYRMTHARRHEAMARLSNLQLTGSGTMVSAGLRVLEREEGLRGQIGSVAVPFGSCVEPSNVKAGGHSCPYRMRCLGCSHFRTDPSYLPELNEYLTQLLMSKEKLSAADNPLEPWARQSAMPSDEEIARVRHLIRRCQHELDSLSEQEHAEINHCIGQVRAARAQTARAVPLELLGIVRSDQPDLFAGPYQRLRSDAENLPTGRVR